MKTKNCIKATLVIITLVLFSPSVVHAGWFTEKKGNYEAKKKDRIEKFAKELGLTQKQQDQLKAQKEDGKAAMEDIRTKMQQKRKELKAELEKDVVDNAKIDSIINDTTALTTQMLRNKVNQMLATKQILTPEQFKKFQEKMEEKKEHMKKSRGGKHMGRHGDDED